MRSLRGQGQPCLGLDIKSSLFTGCVGSVTDRALVRQALAGQRAVIHTATLHKPHIATHPWPDFVDTNVQGTLVLLEEAARAGIESFVYTSTTSAFGSALTPEDGQPAAWITEEVAAIPRNIYGVTKAAAENLCEMFARQGRLASIVLRTARFFPEEDDDPAIRAVHGALNAQANELLYRRVDLEDAVTAHLAAMAAAPRLGFGRYIVSSSTPFTAAHLAALNRDAPALVAELFPEYRKLYMERGWTMFPRIGRVYVNALAQADLGWTPRFDFRHVLNCLGRNEDFRSPLAREVGAKGYHDTVFVEGPYPVTR